MELGTGIDLSALETVGRSLTLRNREHQWQTILVGAKEIGGPLNISTDTDTPSVPGAPSEFNFERLERIKGSLYISGVDYLTSLDVFPRLEAIGSDNDYLALSDNERLSDCCLFPCQVTLNGQPINADNDAVTVTGNLGRCADEQTFFAVCTGPPNAGFNTERPRQTGFTLFTARSSNEDSYRWTVDGRVRSRSRTLFTYGPPIGSRVCLRVTNECGSATSCIKFWGHESDPPDGPKDEGSGTSDGNVLSPETGGKYGYGKRLTGSGNTEATVSPNPFSRELSVTLDLPAATTLQLRLFDVNGKIVHEMSTTEKVNTGTARINLEVPDLPSGVYMLKVAGTDGQVLVTRKLIKR